MLAILLIDMQYESCNRNAESAIQRKKFTEPVMIDCNTNLSDEGIFLKKSCYYQNKNKIMGSDYWYECWKKSYSKNCGGKAFTGKQGFFEKRLLMSAENIQKDNGHFFDLKKINNILPCIEIVPEKNYSYRVKWFDNGMGQPKRHGYNEDLYNKASKLCGKPDTLNKTAFILKENKSGVLKYNYRCTSMEGWHYYKCYHVYIVNTLKLERDVFLRNYDYEYNQMASLF